jgi:hypothetical protein
MAAAIELIYTLQESFGKIIYSGSNIYPIAARRQNGSSLLGGSKAERFSRDPAGSAGAVKKPI